MQGAGDRRTGWEGESRGGREDWKTGEEITRKGGGGGSGARRRKRGRRSVLEIPFLLALRKMNYPY